MASSKIDKPFTTYIRNPILNSSYAGTVYCNICARIGDMVFVNILFHTSNAIPSNTFFITLPFKTTYRCDLLVYNFSTKQVVTDAFGNSGDNRLKVNGDAIPAGIDIYIQGFYITNDS